MWTERGRSRLLFIRIRTAGRRGMVIPISLVALDQLIQAFLELAEFAGDLIPVKFFPKGRMRLGEAGSRMPLRRLVILCREFWDEICSYGRWRVVEIENDQVRLEIWVA